MPPRHARPIAVTEVIRRGNHRRTRAIAQRSIGGLSAVGLGAAVLFTGVSHHPASNPAAAGAARQQRDRERDPSSAGGQISLQVKYRILPTRKIKLLSVTYSGDSKAGADEALPSCRRLRTGPAPGQARPLRSGTCSACTLSSPHHFSGSLSTKIISDANKTRAAGEDGSVTLSVECGHQVAADQH